MIQNLDTAKVALAAGGFTLRARKGSYMIVDDRGLPVHATDSPDRNPYTLDAEDVCDWANILCEPAAA